uniref:VDE lipocalin domain-containing protein n=1 Tax=Chromera velia CCMP2878 TaxID=1169474 RepID=A0A0G4I1W1_9ALVE|mmetsp:Transcript_35279/g.69617  ORF Transcript_35279/g.69617 Transcript_35279/m.69617 type:complete len:370 (-) Transcript_35279:1014-2123(-)|eukprot:Cvel_10235.t1-p1 / transcript=Cvel_10235.t1 / gene=Cvel_10235 / organism=Chromera_velia_CCMP2878 / gene_product=hypothetical protein / transcript_product=hypothetical protein / location=Cvel_scaffold613:17448-21127(+) / protein_length=369 / sequence_SO=supercontig / SO=protein_coding / is_pseudo=false
MRNFLLGALLVGPCAAVPEFFLSKDRDGTSPAVSVPQFFSSHDPEPEPYDPFAKCNPLFHCWRQLGSCVLSSKCRKGLNCARISQVDVGGSNLLNLTNFVPCCYPGDRHDIIPIADCIRDCQNHEPPQGGVAGLPTNGTCPHEFALEQTERERRELSESFSMDKLEGEWWLSAGMSELDWYSCQKMTVRRDEETKEEDRWLADEAYEGSILDFDGQQRWKQMEDHGFFTQKDKDNHPLQLEYSHDRPYVLSDMGLGEKGGEEFFILHYCAATSGVRTPDTVWWTSVILYTRTRKAGPEALAALRAVLSRLQYEGGELRETDNSEETCGASPSLSKSEVVEVHGKARWVERQKEAFERGERWEKYVPESE